jgi:pyridoxamine 5'-phosphate oxidase
MQPLETRKEYTHGTLEKESLLGNPLEQLRVWIEQASTAKILEPNGMTICTVQNSRPSSRVVLLRGIDTGLVFYTNYLSKKGTDIAANAYASASFWWAALERQVRIEGQLQKVSSAESDAYFASRPYESQLASAASPQSQIIERETLEQLVTDLRQKHPKTMSRPEYWGGYRLTPDYLEFWQGRKARLHDRIAYRFEQEQWNKQRLAP